MVATLRLADLLCGLSVVTDLGFGLPPQTAMRSSIIATGLAHAMGEPDDVARDAFYGALLMHIGCVAMSHETAELWGDDLRTMRAVAATNLADPQDWVDTFLPTFTAGMAPATRSHFAEVLQREGAAFGRWYDTGSCEIARETARRLGLPESTQRALHEATEWWDGGGVPRGLSGDDVAVASRITVVASDAAFLFEIGDRAAAVAGLRSRVGRLDPHIVDVFVRSADDLLGAAFSGEPRDRALEVEPAPVQQRNADQLHEVADVFGDACDLKSPFLQGNAQRVTALATRAAERAGLDASTKAKLRIAAPLHDIGRVAVSAGVWGKTGQLTLAEWEQVRMHAYHSERILSGSEALAGAARLAGMHHERADGSGYHRGSANRDIPIAARILGVADAFVGMTQTRPHRAALDTSQAAATLSAESRAGRWDGEVVAIVLDAASGRLTKRRGDLRPAGLSAREVEVLLLVAAGRSNPQVAADLHISSRTAEHHVQHIYSKVGVSTRPELALFALQHGLLPE